MKTTTIRLDDLVVEILDAAADATGETASELIREGILLLFADLEGKNKDFQAQYNAISQRHAQQAHAQALASARPSGVALGRPSGQRPQKGP